MQARQSHKRIRVVRIETTTDNQRIVGLLIPNAAVGSVLQGLLSFPILRLLGVKAYNTSMEKWLTFSQHLLHSCHYMKDPIAPLHIIPLQLSPGISNLIYVLISTKQINFDFLEGHVTH